MRTNFNEIVSSEREYFDNIDELIKTTKQNEEEIQCLKEEVDRIKKERQVRSSYSNKETIDNSPISYIRRKYQNKDIDVNIYKEMLFMATSIDELYGILPDNRNSEFIDIMNALMMKIQKELVFYKRQVLESTDKETLEEAKKEILELEQKKNLLLEYKEEQELIEEDEESVQISRDKKKLLFISPDYNNITNTKKTTLYSDIMCIPKEYHENLSRMLEDLIDGNFREFKSVKGDKSMIKMLELKYGNLRLFFDFIDNEHIIVIGAILKKVNTSSIYKANLRKHSANFTTCKPYIEARLQDQSFIEQNKNITEDILQVLKKSIKKEGKVI